MTTKIPVLVAGQRYEITLPEVSVNAMSEHTPEQIRASVRSKLEADWAPKVRGSFAFDLDPDAKVREARGAMLEAIIDAVIDKTADGAERAFIEGRDE